MSDEGVDAFATFRQFFALRGDVLVLSIAMFAFSLGFQMTTRYVPRYLSVLGAGSVAIGLYGSFGSLLGAVYPYPGGAFSDRIGSRVALTLFGLTSTLGFLVWVFAPTFGIVRTPAIDVGPLVVDPVTLPVGVFLGLLLVQAWKSFGLGATFAIVKQSVPPDRLAVGFASTETFRRTAFLLGPLLAAGALAVYPFRDGFTRMLLLAAGVGLLATVIQHLRYDAGEDSLGKTFAGVESIVSDLRAMPAPLRPLLVGDTLVRFANGMVYSFLVILVVERREVGASLPAVGHLNPDAYFGVLLALEMIVALIVMAPMANLTRRIGLKPVVALGFAVYAVFPAILVAAPATPLVLAVVFAFSGLRFAGLPAHKALIVGPAESDAGGRVVGSYYLVRNVVVIPSAAIGGWLYATSPTLAFGLATVVGLLGTGYFLAFGEEY